MSIKSKETLQLEAQERKHKLDEIKGDADVGAYLQAVPLLVKLSEDERNKLATLLKVRSYTNGQSIITQGEEGNEFFIIKTGKAAVILEDKDQKTQTEIAELKEKDYFGEQALLHKSKRAATVQAKGDVTCFSLDEESFLSIFSKSKLNVRFVKRNAIAEASDGGAADVRAVVEKSEAELAFLKKALKDHVLFQAIPAEGQDEILKILWKQEIANGTKIIKQGEQGNHFYVIQEGEFEVYRKQKEEFAEGEGVDVLVNYLKPGDSFGELALMYNSPRAATVISVTKAVVWVLDRKTFRMALRQVNKHKFTEIATFLDSVPLFHSLLSGERAKIAEALVEVTYEDGEPIMIQGEEGDTFYILQSGEALVKKEVNGVTEVVQHCTKGDFFGERALIKNEPRAASVVAKGKITCLKIQREDFEQLLGHVQDILAERVESLDGGKKTTTTEGGTAPAKSETHGSSLLPIKKEDLVIKTILGKGSFGIVMLVREKNSNQTYALKRLNKAQMVAVGQHLHVINERNVMVQLNHPFIIKLRATYKDRDSLYFLMDVALGGDLFALLRNQTLFDEKVARFYAASIVLAFEHMHNKDIIHRDLKPENVLIDTDGYIKLTDFGFAKVCKDRTWTLCGTPDYLAPEVIQGKGHGKGVDWWTLGILIYEMLASYPPFYDEDPMMTYAKIARGKITIPKHFSRRAVDLIKRLLHPKPTNRLGVLKGGASLIKQHPWFDGFDWEALEKKQMQPPFIPEVTNDTDTSHFLNQNIEDDPIEAFLEDSSSWDEGF